MPMGRSGKVPVTTTIGFAGLTLVENDIANLCLLLHNRQLGQIGTDWLRLHTYLREENHQLGNILHSAEPCMERPICVSNIPYGFVRDATSTHCYCLGDQYAVIPSATGRGLFIALLTGKEAAKYFRLRGTEGTRAYNETLNKALKGRVKGVRWIDESLQQPKRFALIVSLANRFPSVAQWIARQGSLV